MPRELGTATSTDPGPTDVALRLHDPAVTLTDLAVGLEASIFAIVLVRRRPAPAAADGGMARHRWLVASFTATAVAGITGAALHGLFPDRRHPARRRLWRVSLAAISIGGLSAWRLATAISFTGARARLIGAVATVPHAIYLATLARIDPPYVVAIATYLPGAVFLTGVLGRRIGRSDGRGSAIAAFLGLALTFAAAVAQVRHIAIHPRLFDHNATYHAMQAVALACFFSAAPGVIDRIGPYRPTSTGPQPGRQPAARR